MSVVLVDCDNFYVSCERVFQPRLRGRPTLVLSNNDGCVVSRSPEAKALGIPMGVPLFKIRGLVQTHEIQVLSSNYALYGDLSNRVMEILRGFSPAVEIYSIDEAFLEAPAGAGPLEDYGAEIRRATARWLGIPVSVGAAPSKVLAKAAVERAKKAGGVWVLESESAADELLAALPTQDVWGVGRRLGEWLRSEGIHTALALKEAPAGLIRRKMGVAGERLQMELRGVSCLPLERVPNPKRETCVSRSFAHPATTLDELWQALSFFVCRGAEKLRRQRQTTAAMIIFARTSLFEDCPVSLSRTIIPPEPTHSAPLLLALAKTALAEIFRPRRAYKKAGVVMTGLQSDAFRQGSLFEDPSETERDRCLMAAVDSVNRRWGDETLTFGFVGRDPKWRGKQERRSPRFTTNWEELPVAKGGV